MERSKYNKIRAMAIRIFGIFMLFNGIMLAIVAPYERISEEKNCTEFVVGEVTKVEGSTVWIYYELPGEGEIWHVTRGNRGNKKGDELRVFYNPDDLSERYIEGYDEDFPWGDIAIGMVGIAVGIGAIVISVYAKKSEQLNNVIDVLDQ
ncbi:MAG: hypothetical protein IJT96_06590 [Lachnospiraceae bacterium]|nr:hypothetical protein [Lachnospiraceae bacterium]